MSYLLPIYFRQSLNDLSKRHLHVTSSTSLSTETLESVMADKVNKDDIKHTLIEEETTETGKVHVRTYIYHYAIYMYYFNEYNLLPL